MPAWCRANGRSGSSVSEVVPHAAHGEEELRILRIALHLLAQMADVDVDRAWVAEGRVAPQAVEQHRAAEHPARVAGEDREDLELHVGEADRLFANLDGALGEVDAQVARLDRL